MYSSYNLYTEKNVFVASIHGDLFDENGHIDYPEKIEHEGKSYIFWERDIYTFNYREIASEFIKAVQQLFFWQYNRTECFSNMLYDLIAKADLGNKERLRYGFHWEVKAFESWQRYPNPNEFFKKYLNPTLNKGED